MAGDTLNIPYNYAQWIEITWTIMVYFRYCNHQVNGRFQIILYCNFFFPVGKLLKEICTACFVFQITLYCFFFLGASMFFKPLNESCTASVLFLAVIWLQRAGIKPNTCHHRSFNKTYWTTQLPSFMVLAIVEFFFNGAFLPFCAAVSCRVSASFSPASRAFPSWNQRTSCLWYNVHSNFQYTQNIPHHLLLPGTFLVRCVLQS